MEARGFQLAPLRTYDSNGEVRQHPPKGWPTQTMSVLHRLRDANGELTYGLAAVLGPSGLIDVDCDCRSARVLGDGFLPPTARFSRKGVVGHHLYSTTALPDPRNGGPEGQARTTRFANPYGGEKSTLLELRRGPGAQTVVPPTMKPDGHPAEWVGNGIDDLVEWRDEYEDCVRTLAVACLIAEYPDDDTGGRHQFRMDWAGELASRPSIAPESAIKALRAACEYRGHEALDDCEACYRDSLARVEAGEVVTRIRHAGARRELDKWFGQVGGEDVVDIGDDLAKVVERITAIEAAVPPEDRTLFRGQGGYCTIDGLANRARVGLELSRSTKFRRTAKKGPPCTVHPPNNVVDAWMAEQHVEIPELRGKWSGPLVRSDGSVRTEPGYDPATSMWCVGFDGPDVGSTWDDVCAAVGRIVGFVHAGQWQGDEDLAAWLAHVLTVAARPAIEGPVPMFVYTAPSTGSGKTALARTAGVIGGGCSAYTDPSLRDEAELARRLGEHASGPALVLDNMRGVFGSPVVEGAITGGMLAYRPLYVGPVVAPWRCVLAVTSNGAEINRDTVRRSIPIRLAPVRLDARRDLLAEAEGDANAQLRADAATILRSWLLASEGASSATSLASFAEWSRVVAGAVQWVTGIDVVAATRAGAEELASVDEADTEILDVIVDWMRRTNRQDFGSRDLFDAYQVPAARLGPMGETLGEFDSVRKLGRRLARLHDSTRAASYKTVHGQRRWQIVDR